jgi:hypothetical protein
MQSIILLTIIHNVSPFCEAHWISNISSSYGSSENLTEPLNAISSLTYTVFGFAGIIMKNHSVIYYFLMNLFVFMGFGSFFHHLFFVNTPWAYASDIISMYLLSSFSLFYILSDNGYNRIRRFSNALSFLNTLSCIGMLVFYHIGNGPRNILLQIQMGSIIFSQCCICFYFFYIKSIIRYKIFYSSLWNGTLFACGVSMWHFDNTCPDWAITNRFNGHVIWHITVAWALFNTINITNVCRYSFNEVKFTWRPLISKLPGFLYIIDVGTEKTNLRNTYTNINLEEVKLIEGSCGYHRRTNTYS